MIASVADSGIGALTMQLNRSKGATKTPGKKLSSFEQHKHLTKEKPSMQLGLSRKEFNSDNKNCKRKVLGLGSCGLGSVAQIET